MQELKEDYVLETEGLKKYFPVFKKGIMRSRKIGDIKAVDNITFAVRRGEILGVVGESGSGKSTLARVLLNLMRPTGGRTIINSMEGFAKGGLMKDVETGQEGGSLVRANVYDFFRHEDKLWFRKKCQIVFQDPYASLNPRLTVFGIISEALLI